MQVEVESIVQAQKEVVSKAQAAVQDAIASGAAAAAIAPGKRNAGDRAVPAKGSAPAKKPKMLAALETFGSDESDISDSDDE